MSRQSVSQFHPRGGRHADRSSSHGGGTTRGKICEEAELQNGGPVSIRCVVHVVRNVCVYVCVCVMGLI